MMGETDSTSTGNEVDSTIQIAWKEAAKYGFNSSQWIERKVDSIEFDADKGATRISTSYDFWTPDCYKEIGWIPLAVFVKRDLVDLDIRDASGTSLPTLIRRENVSFGMSLLFSGVKQDSKGMEILEILNKIVDFSTPDQLTGEQRKIIFANKRGLIEEYLTYVESAEQHIYRYLAELLMNRFVLWVQIPTSYNNPAARREIIKISQEKAFPYIKQTPSYKKKRQYQIRYAIDIDRSASFHLEVRVPLGMLVKDLLILEPRFTERVVLGRSDNELGQILHVNTKRLVSRRRSYARFSVVSERNTFARISLGSSIIVAMLYVLGIANFVYIHQLHKSFMAPNGNVIGTTILLVGPAIMLFFLANQPEHHLVATVLRIGRRSLLSSALLLVFASTLLSGELNENLDWLEDLVKGLWTCGFLISLWSLWSCLKWFLYWTQSPKRA